jgi:hypothetical protein
MIKSRRMRWAGNMTRMGQNTVAYRVLVKDSIGRPMRRWEDNIEMDFQERGWGRGLDWSG